MHHLIGRKAELDDAAARIRRAIGGHGSALVMVGEAGVGKTSLLDAIAADAGDRMTVVRSRGVEDEMGFSWNGITPILRPLLAAIDDDALSASRRSVLADALSPVDQHGREVSIDLYSLCLALLDLITAAASQRPVLILVDDLHWIDPASARALAFVGRRLDNEYVALVATSRSTSVIGTLPTRELPPIGVDEARAILADLGVSSAAARDALISAVGTNPLLLSTSVGELAADVRRGARPLPDPLDFPATVMDSAARRVDALPDRSRTALTAMAVLGSPSPQEAVRMLESIDTDLSALEPAEAAGIVEITDTIRFTHPTLRTAAYRSADAPEQRRLHRIAAEQAADSITHAMHLAASIVHPDETIAAVVESAAARLAQRGAAASAAEQYVRAAQLSPCKDDESRRRLRSAELYLDLGLITEAEAMLESGAFAPADLGAAHARARLLHLQERDDEACETLRATAEIHADEHPNDAARLLVECLAPLVREGRLSDVLDVVARLQTLRPRLTDGIAKRVDAVGALFSLFGDGSMIDAMRSIDALLVDEGPAASAPFLAEVIAPTLAYANRGDELGELLDSVERTLRDRSAIVPLISVLAAQQLRNFGVDQPRAIGAGEEAIQLADEIGTPKLAMMAAFGLSVAASVAGDAVAYHRAVTPLATSSYPHAEAARLTGLGVLHQTAGRFEQALEAWESLVQLRGVGDPLLTFEADYVETLIRLGRLPEARALLDRLEADGIAQRSPGLFGRVRAMSSDDDEVAAAHFSAAIDACRLSNNRIGEARAELAWGERLRRKRKRAESRPHLERALMLFRGAGVASWAARAEAELHAAGAVVDTSVPVHAILTSQELRVARLVAAGASNRDIGVELFVSQRTVETHLTTIFRKLRVKNRSELAARAIEDRELRPPR